MAGLRTSLNVSAPRSPADSIPRSPAPSSRSNIDWLKNGVDPLERDLDSFLRDHPDAMDHAVARDHEVRVGPLRVTNTEPREAEQHQHSRQDLDDRRSLQRDEPEEDRADERRRGLGHVDPVRAQVEHNLFAVIEELSGERHVATLARFARSGVGCGRAATTPTRATSHVWFASAAKPTRIPVRGGDDPRGRSGAPPRAPQ
jgi:hypothetical protein